MYPAHILDLVKSIPLKTVSLIQPVTSRSTFADIYSRNTDLVYQKAKSILYYSTTVRVNSRNMSHVVAAQNPHVFSEVDKACEFA